MNTQTSNTESSVSRRPDRLNSRPQFHAPVDVYEGKEDYLITADIPGASAEDVDVRFEKNQLNLVARVKQPEQVGGPTEFEWTRSFVLPGSVDTAQIAADIKDGVLQVRLPKKDAVKPRQIAVRPA